MNDDPLIQNVVEAVKCGRSDVVHSVLAAVRSSGDADFLLNGLLTKDGTLLHMACKLGHVDVLRVLMTAGANPETRNTDGETALSITDNPSVRQAFVDELFRASAEPDVSKIKALLQCGISVNVTDCSPSGGNTPLHWAASYGTLHGLNCLLSCGADVNKPNANGLTPLHEAARRGDMDLISALISHGGDPTLRAVSGELRGKTPLDIMKAGKVLVQNGISEYKGEETGHSSPDSLSTGSREIIDIGMGRLSITPDGPRTTPAVLAEEWTKVKASLLWPPPSTVEERSEGEFEIEDGVLRVVLADCGTEVARLWSVQSERFAALGYRVEVTRRGARSDVGSVVCYVRGFGLRGESYRLVVSRKRIGMVAGCCRGMWYCINRLFQLILFHGERRTVPCVTVYDGPTFPTRSFHLEVARGRPLLTAGTLRDRLDVLSRLNCNQFVLCLVLRDATDFDFLYSHEELQNLERFCESRQIELVPGLEMADEASGESAEELRGLLDLVREFLSHFCGASGVHLGRNLSDVIFRGSRRENRTVWNLLGLPTSWTLYLSVPGWKEEFGYSPPNTVFVPRTDSTETYAEVAEFARAGQNVLLCCPVFVPFGSIAGHPSVCVEEIFRVAQLDFPENVVGVTVVQNPVEEPPEPMPCFAWPSLTAFAGLSWNRDTDPDFFRCRLPDLLDAHVFRDESGVVGSTLVELASIESGISSDSRNESATYSLIVDPDGVDVEGLSAAALQQAGRSAKDCQDRLASVGPTSAETAAELKTAAALLLYACRLGRLLLLQGCNPGSPAGLSVINVGLANLPPTTRTDLANRVLELAEQFKATWLLRNTTEGLDRTLRKFDSLVEHLLPSRETIA